MQIEYNSSMKKIAVVGYKGKMGSPIFLALMENFEVVGIGRNDDLGNIDNLDLVIDVASGTSSLCSAEYCLKKRIPLIIGATGQTSEENRRIEEISKFIKIIKKSNFSVGFELLKDFIDRVLIEKPENISIIEKHHIHKKDSPSGTALELKNYIEKKFLKKVHIYSIREGDIKGEHVIILKLKNEEIVIKHNVFSRDAFVDGVIKDVMNLI